MKPPPKLANLQVLRFAAAALVLVYHVAGHYQAAHGALDVRWMNHVGFFGVDVFFVISGFVMWYTAHAKSGAADAFAFIARRARRIFTGYLPVLAFLAVFYFALDGARFSAVDWVSSLTLWPILPPGRAIAVSWSLSFEMLFYLAFSISIWTGRLPLALAGFLAALTIGVIAGVNNPAAPYPMRYFFGMHCYEFAFGVVLAAALRHHEVRAPWAWIALGVAGAAASGYLRATYPVAFLPDAGRIATFGLAAAAIVHGVVGLERSVKPPAALTLLGDASYALYLLHMPVMYLLLAKFPPGAFFAAHLEAREVFVCAVSVAASVAYFKWVERPLLAIRFVSTRNAAMSATPAA